MTTLTYRYRHRSKEGVGFVANGAPKLYVARSRGSVLLRLALGTVRIIPRRHVKVRNRWGSFGSSQPYVQWTWWRNLRQTAKNSIYLNRKYNILMPFFSFCSRVTQRSFYLQPVIGWSYPSGEILFNKSNKYCKIIWNPFRQDVFATLRMVRVDIIIYII